MIKCQVVFDFFPHSGPQAVPAGNKGEESTVTKLQQANVVCGSRSRMGNRDRENRNQTSCDGSGAVSSQGDHKSYYHQLHLCPVPRPETKGRFKRFPPDQPGHVRTPPQRGFAGLPNETTTKRATQRGCDPPIQHLLKLTSSSR